MSMHDLNLVARYCDDVLLLSKADVCSFGSADKVLRTNVLHEVFGLEVLIQNHSEREHPLMIAKWFVQCCKLIQT